VPGLITHHRLGERHSLHVEEKALGTVVRAVEDAGGRILSAQPVRQSLEDYFVKEMGAGPGAAGSFGEE
jgi:hypothetical protein